jgi:hypothetical protein
MLSNFAFECANKKLQENRVRLKWKGACHRLVYADAVNLLGNKRVTIKKKTNFHWR